MSVAVGANSKPPCRGKTDDVIGLDRDGPGGPQMHGRGANASKSSKLKSIGRRARNGNHPRLPSQNPASKIFQLEALKTLLLLQGRISPNSLAPSGIAEIDESAQLPPDRG